MEQIPLTHKTHIMSPSKEGKRQFPDHCIGELANAPSTSKGLLTSVRLHNDFAAHSKGAFPRCDQLTTRSLEAELEGGDGVTNLHPLLRKLAASVLLPLKKGKDGKMEHHMPNCALQHFSDLKSGLGKKFSSVKILQSPHDDLHIHLWRLVRMTASARAFKMGKQTSCGSDSIWKAALEETCRHLIKNG